MSSRRRRVACKHMLGGRVLALHLFGSPEALFIDDFYAEI